jgi:hypothetical protein
MSLGAGARRVTPLALWEGQGAGRPAGPVAPATLECSWCGWTAPDEGRAAAHDCVRDRASPVVPVPCDGAGE